MSITPVSDALAQPAELNLQELLDVLQRRKGTFIQVFLMVLAVGIVAEVVVKRPAGELSKKELAKRMRAVRALIRAGGLSKDVAQRLEIMLETDRGVKKARKQATAGSRLSERTHSDFADRKSAKRGLCTLAASPGRVAPGSPG